MQTSVVSLEPRAAQAIRPLDHLVEMNQMEKFNIALANLEKQVTGYLRVCSQTSNNIELKYISELFFQTKRGVRAK